MIKTHTWSGVPDPSNDYDSLFTTTPDDDPSNDSAVAPGLVSSAAAAPAQVLYLTEPGESGAINVADINQGQLGDCFLLASIGEIVLQNPATISSMIYSNSNGTETVTLYEATNGRLPGFNTASYKAVTETVANVFPSDSVNSGSTQDVVNGQKEIWPQVLENAVATLDGGYSAIANGGSPVIAMEELTGHAASFMSPVSVTLASLQSFVQAGDLVVMDTLPSGALPDGLFSSHAYMFDGISGSGSRAVVHLLNPWGFDQPSPIPVSQLSAWFDEVDIGHLS